jgi:hypothetical protein
MRLFAGSMLAVIICCIHASYAARPEAEENRRRIASVSTTCPVKTTDAKLVDSEQGAIIELTVQNGTSEDLTDLIFSVVRYGFDGRRVGSYFVNTDSSDLPIGAGKTKNVKLPPMFFGDDLAIRVGVSATVPTSLECSEKSVEEAADVEFEPQEFVILNEDKSQVTLSDARVIKSDTGLPLKVTFVAKSLSDKNISGCKIEVFAFSYSQERGTHLRTVAEAGNLTFLSSMSVRPGEIPIRVPTDEKGPVKWKFVLTTTAAVIGQEHWHLQAPAATARAALLSSLRPDANPKL